jgi:hypothetical protein
MTAPIQRLLHSDLRPILTNLAHGGLHPVLARLADADLRPMLTSLTVLAVVAAPAFKTVVHTAGGNWN